MAPIPNRPKTTAHKAAEYTTINPLLEAMYKEFQELSRKKPDGQVGPTKAKMVNRLLKAIHQVLEGSPIAAISMNSTKTTCRKIVTSCSYSVRRWRP